MYSVIIQGTGTTPIVTISGNMSICAGESITLTANGADSYTWDTGISGNAITVSPTVTTIYTVTGTNSSGSDVTSITVIVNALPQTPQVTESNGVLSSSVIGSTYQWFLNSVAIQSANNVSYTPTQSGNYSVQVTDGNGCSSISNDLLWETASIHENEFVLAYYPNPTSANLTIERTNGETVSIKLI
jgi:hypothetical protein